MLQIKDKVPVSVTSWGRTTIRNAMVGGKATSKHLDWLAVDFVADNTADEKRLIDILIAMKVQGVKIKYLPEGDHVHVQSA